MVIDINKVHNSQPIERSWHVRKMMEVLTRQGQIEPLQVKQVNGEYLIFPEDTHGNDILEAARALGWDTLLIVEMKRFEE